MTLALLDTNAYLRLAKRIKPMLGVKFGQNEYVLTILKDIEDEVHRSSRLKYKYPWFDNPEFAKERLSAHIRLSKDEREQVEAATSVLLGHVRSNTAVYLSHGRSPPSSTDCYILAFGQIRPAIVVTDDLGMHQLAKDFEISVWHGHELLKKMLSAKAIANELVREIYDAMEANSDLTASWKDAKHKTFKKIFGPQP